MMMINFTHLEEILAILIFFFITFFFALNLRRVKHVRREVSEKRKSSMLREKGNGTLLINFSLFCTLLLILFFSPFPHLKNEQGHQSSNRKILF